MSDESHAGGCSSQLPLLEKALCLLERDRSEEESLWLRYNNVKEQARRIWRPVRLRWFTDHGPEHSARIVRLIGQIIQPLYDNFERPFSRHELYVLLVSCYLHDIGMQDLRIDGKSLDELGPEDYEEIRRRHAKRSAEIIIKQTLQLEGHDFSLGLERNQLLGVIARICQSHSTDFFDGAALHLQSMPIRPDVGEEMRGDVLAALLMMGDELDLHQNRVTHLFSAYTSRFEEFSPISSLHIYKHHYITSVQVTDGDIKQHRCIELGFVFPKDSEQYADLLKRWVLNKLYSQCQKTQPYLKALGLLWDLSIEINSIQDDLDTPSPLPEKIIQHLQKEVAVHTSLPGGQIADTASNLELKSGTDQANNIPFDEKDPVVKWLQKLKFSSRHPFAGLRAERDRLLRKSFLTIPSFEALTLNQHTVICGKDGSGKTSCMRMLRNCIDEENVLVVEVKDFFEVLHIASDAPFWVPAQAYDASKLKHILVDYFNSDELQSLCFDLGVDYDALKGESRDGKARELVTYLERRGRATELMDACIRLRPNASWHNVTLDAQRELPFGLLRVEKHIQQVLKSSSSLLLKLICLKKRHTEAYGNLRTIRQTRLLRYLYDYVELGDRQLWLDDGLVARNLPSVGELRVHGVAPRDNLVQFARDVIDLDDSNLPRLPNNPSRLLNGLREILNWFGFETVLVLYDDLAGFGHEPQDIGRLLIPLLDARTLLDSIENVYFKFFLPLGLDDILKERRAIQAGSIRWLSPLVWKLEQLRELYQLRLEAATEGRYDSLAPITEPAFSDIDQRLVEAVDTPRELLRLGGFLLDAHLQNHGDSEDYLLSERDFADALAQLQSRSHP